MYILANTLQTKPLLIATNEKWNEQTQSNKRPRANNQPYFHFILLDVAVVEAGSFSGKLSVFSGPQWPCRVELIKSLWKCPTEGSSQHANLPQLEAPVRWHLTQRRSVHSFLQHDYKAGCEMFYWHKHLVYGHKLNIYDTGVCWC